MFENENAIDNIISDDDGVLKVLFTLGKWLLAAIVICVLLVAPALVVYCRWGADADANGTVTRAEYDANVDTILGTGVLSYLKPVMAYWEKVVFIVLPVTETA